MRKQFKESATRVYHQYKKAFEENKLPENAILTVIKEDGIYAWGNECVYKAGESLEDYLARKGNDDSIQYPVGAFGIFDTENGYRSRGDMGWFGISSNDKDEEKWHAEMQEFIKSVPDDEVLVMLDCHI